MSSAVPDSSRDGREILVASIKSTLKRLHPQDSDQITRAIIEDLDAQKNPLVILNKANFLKTLQALEKTVRENSSLIARVDELEAAIESLRRQVE